MSAESPRHVRSGGPLTVPSQPPSDRSIIDAVSGFINDVTLSASSAQDPKDVIQWARFETADINEPTPEDASDTDISPLLLILGYGAGVQVWLISPTGEAQEVLSWRQGSVRVLRILPTPQRGDCFASKRPLIALCDSASPGPTFCSLSFISIRGGEQVKSIKFKNPILDVLANKRSVVVSFSERFAVFDAGTLEDRMTVTTCYPCPCPLGGSQPINPLALGDRWLAYAEKKLNQSKRSSGGFEGEGVTSYTATVLHAAKSLSKGLRGLGETVAHSLSGGRSASQSPSPPNADLQQPGVVTIIDIEGHDEDVGQEQEEQYDPVVAHFVAHSEAIIAVQLDASGLVAVTADRRGHDFHVFRINPHPCGPAMASVHHLYVLHRGDTTAKVQDIALSFDTRWAAVSTLRGTTHIFAISPYGGACGVRTHTAPRVVNRLSRFHRSAGLPIHGAHLSASPVSDGCASGLWFPNPRLPPHPAPAVCAPLAQLRPTASLPTHTITRTSSGRQRLSSLSEDSSAAPLLARARFGPGASAGSRSAPAAALYLMAATGCLSHIALHPRPARNVAKEKICDETPIELEVEPIAQWPLQRPAVAGDLLAPLPPSNPLLQPMSCRRCADMCMNEEERWLSQVEIVTHAGPHRRLWMGPQFVFKTYNCTGSNSSLSEAETVEVDPSASLGAARSTPVNMPGQRPIMPVLIDSGSASSLEHSPSDSFRRKSLLAESGRAASVCDVQLKEDLAEAMREDQGWCASSERAVSVGCVERAVDPLGWVVAPGAARAPPPADPDAHTCDNADEARFRPVVRAPAAVPPAPELLARPLPRTTTIPVQTVRAPPAPAPHTRAPRPLTTDVVIPAALTHQPYTETHVARQTVEPPHLDSMSDVDVTERPVATVDTPIPPKPDAPADDAPAPLVEEPENIPEVPARRASTKSSKSDARAESKKKIESDAPSDDRIRKRESKFEKSPPKLDKPSDKNDVASRIDKSFKQKDVAVDREERPPTAEIEERKECSPLKIQKEFRNIPTEPSECSVTDVSKVDSVNVDFKVPDVNKDLKGQVNDESERDRPRERTLAERPERECKVIRSLPKSNQASDDIQPTARTRIKKSPTPKSVSDRDSEFSVKDKQSKRIDESIEVNEPKEIRETKENKKQKHDREIKENVRESKETRTKKDKLKDEQDFVEIVKDVDRSFTGKESKHVKDESQIAVTLKEPTRKHPEIKIKSNEEDIRTEEQAWDMLLSESEKPVVFDVSPKSAMADKVEEKPKSKRNRKAKKSLDELLTKTDDDSFVEIHAIEEKQTCSGDLVSISAPFEDVEPASSYLTKMKKIRRSKTPEKTDEFEIKPAETIQAPEPISYSNKLKGFKKMDDLCNVNFMPPLRPVELFPQMDNDLLKGKKHYDGTASETFVTKDLPKTYKSKSLSPYPESKKLSQTPLNKSEKDVYVINTTVDDFPEIQITKGNKPRKRSPQPIERKAEVKESVAEKPAAVKSWSSIAASKNTKKVEDSPFNVDITENKPITFNKRDDFEDIACALDNPVSSTTVSLQEKLFELCKRTDIMVAECDAPSELNFVDEHHAVLPDLPPLEPLDFALDDYKLEVMRDSLIDVRDTKITSPICKINIDDILSSIKETTSKAIESSAFNFIDLEKLPSKREKGFSVIEGHKITTQEVKFDIDRKAEEGELMEKSSDEDAASPMVSTDSDKEDKKTPGASNLLLPSSKQSSKSKKSRRKKK